jgi:general secretion pathway protein G
MKNRIRKLLSAAVLHDTKGFTLTEMIIVIALIALIGTFVTSNVIGRYNKAKIDSSKIQMKQLSTILEDYRRDCNYYPDNDQGLDALVKKPTGGRECKNYDPEGYIKGGKVPKDSFGNDFGYSSDGTKFKIMFYGRDGKEGGEGLDKDISSDELD